MPIPVVPTALSSLGNSLRSTDNGFLMVDIIIMPVWMKKKLTVDTEKAHYMLAVQTAQSVSQSVHSVKQT